MPAAPPAERTTLSARIITMQLAFDINMRSREDAISTKKVLIRFVSDLRFQGVQLRPERWRHKRILRNFVWRLSSAIPTRVPDHCISIEAGVEIKIPHIWRHGRPN